MEQPSPELVQLNVAETQVNVARDYHDIKASQSIALFLATTPQADIDAMTLDNVNLFRHRFGFEAPLRKVRAQLLDIVHQHELSDREVRSLRRGGQLRVTRASIELIPDRRMSYAGWFQVALVSVFCLMGYLQITLSDTPQSYRIIGQLAMGAFWLGSVGVFSRLYLAPWALVRNVGIR